MTRKRLTAAILAVSLICGLFSSCGSSDNESANAASGGAATIVGNSNHNNKTENGNSISDSNIRNDSFATEAEAYDGGDFDASPAEVYDVAVEPYYPPYAEPENGEEYTEITENGFVSVSEQPLSTFSADVDTASYTAVRRMIKNWGYVEPSAVRIEEMINYFSYDYKDSEDGTPFSVTTELSECPWNPQTKLLSVGIKANDIRKNERPNTNVVFLLDVSGSMYSEDKLPLVQDAFALLAEGLTENDRVSIVTYAGADEVVLEGVEGNKTRQICEAVYSLEAGGATAGAAGIVTAYDIAEKYFIRDGVNRVILATDGDLNVGLSSVDELTDLIEKERKSGVFLSVLGFGDGNYKDNRLEALADNGNGNYSYIDCIEEAEKVLVEEMNSTMFTVAKDVKFQVEFNPANVKGYRLIGYENRALAAEDFADDTKDAGEVGAGHTVTALYEIVTADSDYSMGGTPELKYQPAETTAEEDAPKSVLTDELLTVNIRYKEPDGDVSKLISKPVMTADFTDKPSGDFKFAAAVAEFGMLLRDSRFAGNSSYEDIQRLIKEADVGDDKYKTEFARLTEVVR